MVCRDFLQLLHRLKIVTQSFLPTTIHNHRTVCCDFLQLIHRLKKVPQSFLSNTIHNHRTSLLCVAYSIHLT
jgi:hypothetical protein